MAYLKSILNCFLPFLLLTFSVQEGRGETPIAYDLEMAKEICQELPLDNIEGIWIYPDDRVTVMILKEDNSEKISSLASYSIRVVEGEDVRLEPGQRIGTIETTPNADTFKIELFTEEKNHLLLKPESCLASLSKDAETLIIKKSKSPFRLRLNLNFNRLLPGFWKIVSLGINRNQQSQNTNPPVGMVKIYPSYDGHGGSRHRPRYL